MFDALADKLQGVFSGLKGRGKLTEADIDKAMRAIRLSLLEADVSLPVVKQLTSAIAERAKGAEVMGSLTPDQQVVKIVSEELTTLMGEANVALPLASKPPTIVLMAGLQGSGKTTTTGKLAKLLKDGHKKKVLVVSTDIYRPAAIEQLKTVAAQAGVEFFPSATEQKPVDIALAAVDFARKHHLDVLLVDTAGRLPTQLHLMEELTKIRRVVAKADATAPHEVLLVIDGNTGQNALSQVREFNEAVGVTGLVLTKLDGTAKGGIVVAIARQLRLPIRFIGIGEGAEDFGVFDARAFAEALVEGAGHSG